jgi:hypothetical protein
MSSADGDLLNQAWGYIIPGVTGIVIAIVAIIIGICWQHRKEQALKDQQKAARSARLLKLQQQSDSFTNVAYRADTDILTRLGMSQIQPNPVPSQNSPV